MRYHFELMNFKLINLFKKATVMKKRILHVKARVARTVCGAALLALAALPGYGQGDKSGGGIVAYTNFDQGGQGGSGAQTGGGSAGTTTGAGTPGTEAGTGTTTGTGTGSLGAPANTGTPKPGTDKQHTPFGTGSRQPIPAGSSPPSNTTITNPTGTYDSGGNPALTSPLDNGNTGTVPAYDATPNTNPAAAVPANGTNGVRNDSTANPPANANRPATTNDTQGTGTAGSGTKGRDYR
jgi:hypothetical protein